MSYQYHGTTDLIALPNRTVQTYPSGLVRVERSFVCRKDRVAKFRNTIKVNEPMPLDDGAPAIDGLFIFPEPQELVRDDGFAEFRVTAYGRTNIFSQIAVEKSSARGVYAFAIQAPAGSQLFNLAAINEIYTFRGVLESSASITELIARPEIENPTVIAVASGQPLAPGVVSSGSLTTTTSIFINLDSFSSTNFGRWSEYAVSWQAAGNVVRSSF
jgi:hypothetical protein